MRLNQRILDEVFGKSSCFSENSGIFPTIKCAFAPANGTAENKRVSGKCKRNIYTKPLQKYEQ